MLKTILHSGIAKKIVMGLLTATLILLIAIEAVYRFAALETKPALIGNCAVLVLGYSTEDDGTLSSVQHARVEAGIKIYHERRCNKIVFSGGAVANQYVEAETMANFARASGVSEQHIVIENRARNTWENIGCSVAYLQDYQSIPIVSDILHAKRAQRYLCRQKPGLCARSDPIGHDFPWPLVWWKAPSAVYEFCAWLRDRLFYEGGRAENEPACRSRFAV